VDAARRAALACLSARFSFNDFPDFLVMVCRGDLSDITGPLHHGGLVGPDCPPLLHDAELIGSSGDDAPVSVPTPSAEKWRNVVDIEQLGCERTCSTEKENLMASPTTFRSPYVQRVELVRDTIMSHSKLGDKAASELAEHVLHALNSIPEKVR
jgi:Family of unknown function (DUF6307)